MLTILERKWEIWPGEATPPADAPALTGDVLGGRFHFWRGVSGRRHLCTIFDRPSLLDGLSEAVVLAIRNREGARMLIDVAFDGPGGPPLADFAQATKWRGADEWHVHLLAASFADRQAVARDMLPHANCAASHSSVSSWMPRPRR